MQNSKHKVSKSEVLDAIDYFHGIGMIQNQSGDSKHYLEILLRKVANDYKLLLTYDGGKVL